MSTDCETMTVTTLNPDLNYVRRIPSAPTKGIVDQDGHKVLVEQLSRKWRPSRFIESYWFSEGSIMRFFNQWGFEYKYWLVQNGHLIECSEDGVITSGAQPVAFPSRELSFHYRNVHGETEHAVIREWDRIWNETLQLNPDSSYARLAEIRKINEAIDARNRETMNDLQRLMNNMDWSFEYADCTIKGAYERRREIFRRLEALPYKDAVNYWVDYGAYCYSENPMEGRIYGRPDFTKCQGYEG